MTIQELLKKTAEDFSMAKVECGDKYTHAVDFLNQVTGFSREKLLFDCGEAVPPLILNHVEEAKVRRLSGEPLQYIMGSSWFWDCKLKVGPGVFIPRRETEHLVEYLLSLDGTSSRKVAELGAGSGCIGISVLRSRPHWQWFGFEKNPESLPYLLANIETELPHGTPYHIVEGDFFLESLQRSPFDLVVANPPYVSLTERGTLSREVHWEPAEALFSGECGLEHFEKMAAYSIGILVMGGHLISEIGCDQKNDAVKIVESHGYKDISVLKDMAGLDRVLVARKGD